MAQPKKNTVTNVSKVCVTMEMLLDAPPSSTPPRFPVRSAIFTFLALISVVALLLAFRLLFESGAVPPPPLEIDMALFNAEPFSTSDDFDSDPESTETTAARTRKHPATAAAVHMMISALLPR